MNTRVSLLSITAVVILLGASGWFATPADAMMIKVPLTELVQQSDWIVVGQVTAATSHWDANHAFIETDVTISLTDEIKVAGDEHEFLVRVLGGEVDGEGFRRSDEPRFEIGETVLVFLNPDPDEKGVFRVAAAFQGKYTVDTGVLVENNQPLDEFIGRINAILAGAADPVPDEDQATVVPLFAPGGEEWPDSAMPIQYYIESPGLANCKFSEYWAIRRAAKEWQQVPGAYWSLCYGGTTTTGSRVKDGENAVVFGPLTGYLGYADWWFDTQTDLIYEADFTINSNLAWCADTRERCDNDRYDVESVATHEFGHWLSLNHSGVSGATMKTGLAMGAVWQRHPAPDDMAGIRWIYPHTDGIPKPQPGCWPWSASLMMVWTSLGTADIDRDGTEELIVGGYGDDNGVWAINGDGKPDRGDGINPGKDLSGPAPALGDLDFDGWLEVVVPCTDSKIYVRNHNDTAVAGWPAGAGGAVYSTPALGDIDGDGGLEVVVGSDAWSVYAWNANGTILDRDNLPPWDWPQLTSDLVRSSPALADLNGDDQPDVVVGCDDGQVYAWDYTGTALPGWPVTTGDKVRSSPAVGDIDGDDELEVVVGCDDGQVYAWEADGTPLGGWPVSTGGLVRSSPALGDLDGDGKLDVAVGSNDAQAYVWDYTGTLLAGWPRSTSGAVSASPIIGDVDGDGAQEVVVASEGGWLYAWNGDGTMVTGWYLGGVGAGSATPSLGDIDGNGELEVCLPVSGGIGSGIKCWDLGSPYDEDTLAWPMFGHDRYRGALAGFAPPPVTPLPYSDPFDPGWSDREWGMGGAGCPGFGLAGSYFVSAPLSLSVTGSSSPDAYAWAQSRDIAMDLAAPYHVTFFFRTTNFAQSRFFAFGHARLMLDTPGTPLLYDADGEGTWLPFGPPANAYLSPGAWTLFEIDVDPTANSYSVVAGGVPLGAVSYDPSMLPAPALYFEDGPEPGSVLEAQYDDIQIEGTLPPECRTPGDFDCDGDVDLSDYGTFLDCYNGPTAAPADTCVIDTDLDTDGDVDLSDYGMFLDCYNGPNRPAACL